MNSTSVILLVSVLTIGIWQTYSRYSLKSTKRQEHRWDTKFRLTRIAVDGAVILLYLLFIFDPQRIAAAAVIYDTTLMRWLGNAIIIAGLALYIWTQYTLGRNWWYTTSIQEGHVLITKGPYRHIRHPMYTAFLTLVVGALIATANALLFFPLLVYLQLFSQKTRLEEEVLGKRFGQQYKEYMARTGKFLPRLHI